MLSMAEAETEMHRRDFPIAAGMYEKFSRDIRPLMAINMK
jgi:hypothetical protein